MGHLVFCSDPTFFLLCVFMHLLYHINQSEATHTFAVSFQSDGSWSTDHWMKYKENITGLNKEFTTCHWEKLRYFSTELNAIWAYCYMKSKTDTELRCFQLFTRTNLASAGRNINVVGMSSFWVIESYPLRRYFLK